MRTTLPRLAAALAATLTASGAAAQDAPTLFAAASLGTALDEIAAAWKAQGRAPVSMSLAGSSALARQIEAGAPADVFVSASAEWMDALEAQGLIDPASRTDLLTNEIVLVSAEPRPPVEIGPGLDLAGLLGDGRLAMALVDSVPAGVYGREALQSLGLWDEAEPRVAQADNVRAALALVAAGEAPLGIVYRTDAAAEPGVTILGAFPAETHAPIVYPAAMIADAGPEGAALLAFLQGPEADAAFERQGFGLVPAP